MTQNKWKKLFLGLLILNIAIIITFVILLNIPAKETKIMSEPTINDDLTSVLSVESNKDNLNELIKAYLNETLEDTKYKYDVYLDEAVHLEGELPVFSASIPLYIQLQPDVQPNGDIILKQKSIKLGLLRLPNEKILEYVEKYLPLPEWVTIDSKNEDIYVKVTEMDLENDFGVEVRDFDLEKDKIRLDFIVPHDIFKKAKETY